MSAPLVWTLIALGALLVSIEVLNAVVSLYARHQRDRRARAEAEWTTIVADRFDDPAADLGEWDRRFNFARWERGGRLEGE